MEQDEYDVVVVGGGAAGLAGAVALARSRRSVVVVDAGEPRNASADGVHNYLGREGIAPGELLLEGRDELRAYGGVVLDGSVIAVRAGHAVPTTGPAAAPPADLSFAVELADGRVLRARRVLVATGAVDELPDVEGLRGRWGRDVIHCPYCHGYEVRDQRVAILGTGPMSVHQALLFRQLTDDVLYVAHAGPPLTDEAAEQLAARAIRVIEGPVASVEVEHDRIVALCTAEGGTFPRDVVVVAPRMVARAAFLGTLGLTAVEHPMGVGEHVPADPTGRTDVPGVWVAGNVTDLTAQVGASAAAGAMAGAQINADLVMEETATAVEAAREAGQRSA